MISKAKNEYFCHHLLLYNDILAFHDSQIWLRVSGADTMMSAQPNLYKQLQTVKPAADVIESIDMGESDRVVSCYIIEEGNLYSDLTDIS